MKASGLLIARQIYSLPERSGPFGYSALPNVFADKGYPNVESSKHYIEITASLGELRHGLPTLAFSKPLRVVFREELIGKKLDVHCELFGKQLRKPRSEHLAIQVIAPDQAAVPAE